MLVVFIKLLHVTLTIYILQHDIKTGKDMICYNTII